MNSEIDFEESVSWLIIPITLVGGFLRMLYLSKNGMWLDETFSVWMASHSIADMLQWVVRIDQHPPLYYLLLHYWIAHNGESPYDVRLLSVLFSVGTIPIIFLIGKRISGVLMGLAAAMFLALSLFNIYYAQETRMYTLLTFNAAIAIYALVRLLTDPRSVKPIGSQFRDYLHAWRTSGPVQSDKQEVFSYADKTLNQSGWRGWVYRHRWSPLHTIETDLAWIALIVFSVATMLSHNSAVLFTIAANFFVLGLILFQRIKKSGSSAGFQVPTLGNWVKAQIAIFVLWSPWLAPFIKQASTVYQRFWIPEPTWDSVIEVLKSFLYPSAQMSAGQASVIWTLYALVLCLGLVYFRKKFSQFIFLAALIAVPFLGELVVSIRRPIFLDKTLIWTTIPLYLVLAAGITQLRFRPLIILVLGVFGTLNLFSVADYYRFSQKEDWKTAAGYVAYYAEKDDLILFNSNFVKIPFDYYFWSYEDKWRIQVEKRGFPLDLIESGILEPEMTANDIPELISLLRGRNRVWLVYSHETYTDPMGLIPKTLASQMELIRTKDFHGGQVQLYETPQN